MITLAMIVKNEEEVLYRALKSVRDFVHRVVVVDTGSTDRTVDIARDLGADTCSFDWIDDFSAARNYALSCVKTPWTMTLDADDIVLNPHIIPNLIEQAHEHHIDALFGIYWQDSQTYQRRCQIFKTKAYRWQGVVHESPQPKQPERSHAAMIDLEVMHLKPESRAATAAQDYLDILLAKDPENWLGLAESYRLLNDYAKAEQNYWKAFNYPKTNDATKYAAIFQVSCMNIELVKRDKIHLQLAYDAALLGVSLNPNRAECYVNLGQCLQLMGMKEEAKHAYRCAMNCQQSHEDVGLVYKQYYDVIPQALLEALSNGSCDGTAG